MGEIDKGSIYLALGRKSIAKEDKIPPLGGRPVTPKEEARVGEQLRRELDDYERPMLEARGRVFEAMSGRSINLPED